MNLLPSRLSGLLVLPKPPPGICVDVRDGVPVETGLLPRRFCVFKGERVREREFKRVSHKGRPKFKIPIPGGFARFLVHVKRHLVFRGPLFLPISWGFPGGSAVGGRPIFLPGFLVYPRRDERIRPRRLFNAYLCGKRESIKCQCLVVFAS